MKITWSNVGLVGGYALLVAGAFALVHHYVDHNEWLTFAVEWLVVAIGTSLFVRYMKRYLD